METQPATKPVPQPTAPKFRVHHYGLFVILLIVIVFIAVNSGIYLYKTTHKQNSNQSPANQLQQLANTTKNTATTVNKMTDLVKLAPTLIAEQKSTIPKVQIIPATSQPQTGTGSMTWLTYQNPSYQFSLTYPGNLELKQTNEGLGVTSVELRSAQNTDGNNAPDYQFLIFSKTIGNLIGQNFDTFYAMPTNSSQVMKGMQGSAEEQFTKVDNRTIAGLRAFDYQTTSSPPKPNEQPEIGSYVEIGDNMLIIATGADNKSTLEQMIASFKYPN